MSKHRTLGPQFELEACLQGISTEHLHSVKRELVQVFANQIQLLQDVVSDCDDMAADTIRVEDIEQLAGAGPG